MIFQEWCVTNRLTVNLSKTYYMFFSNESSENLPLLLYQNDVIKKTTQHTLLGVTIEQGLTFKQHLSGLCLKLSRVIYLLHQVKDLMPLYVLKILYHGHVLSHLSYCTAIWVGGGGVGSVMDCHSQRRDNAGSNPHATTDFSVTAEWPKTAHMLPRRSSINPDSRRTHPVNQE